MKTFMKNMKPEDGYSTDPGRASSTPTARAAFFVGAELAQPERPPRHRGGYGFQIPALLAGFMIVGCGGMALPSSAQTISEPHTVFYGKVLGTASIQDFLITTGRLTWTIQRADGVSVTLKSSLYSFHNDTFSYRLNVPHSAFALGLNTEAGGIPLPPIPEVHVHASISVDGQPAMILGPAGVAFTTEQLLRTSTYRLDLGLNRKALDTDGDGIPDWWEDRYGLDKQDPADASGDLNGDGLSALDAYRKGLDPTRDARTPELLTEEVIVYLSGSTGILLDTADLDSTAAQLIYTLNRLPPAGTLSLRNAEVHPVQPDAILTVGSQFTQADLLKGRLIYDHDGSNHDPGSFEVEVRDENSGHETDSGTIRMLAYQPADLIPDNLTALESQRLENHFYAGMGYVILDGSALGSNAVFSTPSSGLTGPALEHYLAAYGNDRPYVLIGGATSLTGGHADDVLVAPTPGSTLAGGEGEDRFVISSFNLGKITVADFAVAQHDVLDMSRIPVSPGVYAHRYLRLVKTAGVYQVQTDLDGDGIGFTNATVALPGLTDAQADLYTLVESGRVRIGSLQLEPRISVTASQPQASENGPTEGRFTLTRQGSLAADLTVNVVISGSAQNGVDYMMLPSMVTMAAGVASVDVPVTPYPDGATELAETVQMTLAAGAGYRLGPASLASVTIEDLLMLVEIEAVETIAIKESASPGLFMITRRDVITRDALIRLTITGTASNGVDYNRLTNLVYMVPNQSVAFVQVMPRTTAVLAGGLESVAITIRPDPSYRVSGAGSAQVLIIERNDSFAGWRAREFPETSGDAATFAASDDGNTGVTHFQRYAFGLDPHQPDLDGLPRPFLHDGRLVVSFRKPVGIHDVQYRVVASADLLAWAGRSVPVSQITAPVATDDPARIYYQVESEESTAFIVVEAEWLP